MFVKVFLVSTPVENEIITQCKAEQADGEIRYYRAWFSIGQTDFFGVDIYPDHYNDEDGERMFDGVTDFDRFAEHVAKLLNENKSFLDLFNEIYEFGDELEQFRGKELEDIDRETNYTAEGLPKCCDVVEWYLLREFQTDEEF